MLIQRDVTYEEFRRMPKILVGSKAVELNINAMGINRLPEFRKSKDIDFLLPYQDFKFKDSADCRIDAHGIDEHIFWDLADRLLYKDPNSKYHKDLAVGEFMVPDLAALYTLKSSHATFDIHWEKTMWDIDWFQRSGMGIADNTLLGHLYEFWMQIHPNRKDRIKLNKSNEDFFNDKIKRKYVHDDLHKAVKYYEHPLYELMKDDVTNAMLSRERFEHSPAYVKLKLCREEIYVTALERFWIPLNGEIPAKICYRYAIKKLVTSMTKGWFPAYIIQNFNELKTPDKDYVADFEGHLNAGLIRTV